MTKNSTVGNRHGSAIVTTPSDTEILITRQFDAPAALIFRAWTEPDLVKQWWGFETGKWLVCDVDLRVGGQWRWVVMEGDMEVGFHGEYQEIDAPHRLVTTEIYEGAPDAGALNIMTLEEVDGVTTLTVARPARDQGATRRRHRVRHGRRHAGLDEPHGRPRAGPRLAIARRREHALLDASRKSAGMASAGALPVDPSNADAFAAWDGGDGDYWAEHADLFDRSLTAYGPAFSVATASPSATGCSTSGAATGRRRGTQPGVPPPARRSASTSPHG